MHKLISLLTLFLACCIAAGCQKAESDETSNKTEEQDMTNIPGMVTTDVSMLVSDSGVLRYHAISPIWYRYNLDPKNPYWYFPQGLELDELDDNMQISGKIICDTAYHYEKLQQWHLIGHVHVANVKDEKFETENLFWDMRQHKVYSDTFIHIERHKDILEGFGFTSNEAFTEYQIRQTTGIFEIRHEGEAGDYESDAPDDGEQLVENGEPGTSSAPVDTVPAKPLTPQEKANLARQRRNRGTNPQDFRFDPQR